MQIKNRIEAIIKRLPPPYIDTTPIIIVSGEPMPEYIIGRLFVEVDTQEQKEVLLKLIEKGI